MLAAFVVMVIDSPDSNNGELWATVQPVDSLGHVEVTQRLPGHLDSYAFVHNHKPQLNFPSLIEEH